MAADVMSKPVRFTRHALSVMKSRDVTPEEVIEIIRNPDVTEPSEGQRRYVANGLAVAVDVRYNPYVVITVLMRNREQWTNENVRTRSR